MTKVILPLLLLFSQLSLAGENWFEKGNGGFVIFCDNKAPQTLDIFEMHQHQWTLDEKESSTTMGRVNYLISRIMQFNPRRAKLYQEWAESFFAEAELLPRVSFGPMPDLGKTDFEGCKPQHVIYQRQPNALHKYRYTVNSTVWNALSPLHQAALIMHEIIYREMALPPNGHLTSEFSRNFNSWLNSKEFEKVDIQDYLKMLQSLNVVKADYLNFGILLAAKDIAQNSWSYAEMTYLEGRPLSVILDASVPVETKDYSFEARCKSTGKLTSYGVAFIHSDDASIFQIEPLKTSNAAMSALVENCLVTTPLPNPNPPGYDFYAAGEFWNLHPVTRFQSTVGKTFFGSATLDEGPFYADTFDVVVGPTHYPVDTMVHFFHNSPKSGFLEFWGEVCRKEGKGGARRLAILSAKTIPARHHVWYFEDMEKSFYLIKVCK